MKESMKVIVAELDTTVQEFSARIQQIPEAELLAKPRPDKWSRIEVIGHLIDSAHSNLRRFVTAQYEASPPHIIYDQNFWVTANGYQHAPAEDVISLWILMNQRIAAVLAQMPEGNYTKQCDTGRGQKELHTIEWLAADYVKHLKHHLNQVIPGSYPVTYP